VQGVYNSDNPENILDLSGSLWKFFTMNRDLGDALLYFHQIFTGGYIMVQFNNVVFVGQNDDDLPSAGPGGV